MTNNDTTTKMTTKNIKDTIALMMAKEHALWKIARQLNWPANWRRRYKAHTAAIEKFCSLHLGNNSLQLTLSGHCDTANYDDIDTAINVNFAYAVDNGDIVTDSESGQFFCHVSEHCQRQLSTFLHQQFPTLRLTYSKAADYIKPFKNWTAAEHYCQHDETLQQQLQHYEAKLAAEPVVKQLQALDHQIEQLQLQKQQLLNSL